MRRYIGPAVVMALAAAAGGMLTFDANRHLTEKQITGGKFVEEA